METPEGKAPEWKKWTHDADALITTWGSPRCTAAFLEENAPNAKIVGHSAGSVGNLVDETTEEKGIVVTTANHIMAESVAEYSLSATLFAQRNYTDYAKLRQNEKLIWENREHVLDLAEATIGIWGLGDITRHFLRMLSSLRIGRILVYSRHASGDELDLLGAQKTDWHKLFSESDILHCLSGSTSENAGKIGERELQLMHDGAWIINAGRAGLIQEEPLLKELRSGRIRGMFDVYYKEPLAEDSPWQGLDNVILTPHNAGWTGLRRYIPFLLEEFRRFFTGGTMIARVSPNRRKTMTTHP
jgi:phosphoglycerate dehydrogenase-like enzyme